MSKIKKILKYILGHPKQDCDQRDTYFNWIFYRILEKKYKKYCDNMDIYPSTGKISNKVWWCWLQGEENAPELNKTCLKSLRKNLKDREIIIITLDNYSDYITLPQYIIEKFNKKQIPFAQFSDIIRLELLIKHGGTWIDSSVLCTKYNKNFFDKPLFMFKNWMKGDSSIVSSNWFITAEKNNPLLLTTRNLLYKYWKEHNYLIHYYIFHFFFTMVSKKYSKLWKEVPKYSNVPPHVLQFELLEEYNENRYKQILSMSDFHKLNQGLDFSKAAPNSNYDYILKKYNK